MLVKLEELLSRSKQDLSKALELLERGDVRDAAEKAWSSIENMRKALLVAVKIPYDLAKNISTGVPLFIRILRALNRKDLLEKYFFFNSHIHIYGFYEMITPEEELETVIKDEVPRWISQMEDAIRSIKDIDLSNIVDILLKAQKLKSEILRKSKEYADLQAQLNMMIRTIISQRDH